MNRELDVLISGYYGFGNLGDEMIANAVVSLLVDSGIKKQRIGILSAAPEETEEQLGITAFNRWSLIKVFKTMRSARSLFLGGGGLFQDSTSIRSCLYYWGIVKIANLSGTRIWAAGQSIGPLKSVAAAFLARKSFSSCIYRSVRNKSSLAILNNWGLLGVFAPDLVMTLKVKRDFVRGDNLLLNIRSGYECMSKSAVEFAVKTAAEKKLRITGVAFSQEDVAEFHKYSDSGILKLDQITVVKNLSEFENVIENSSYAIGMRLHFLVLSLLAGIPLCGVPYDPKVRSFCEEWNIPFPNSNSCKFSIPPGIEILYDTSEKVAYSFRQGLKLAMGEANVKN